MQKHKQLIFLSRNTDHFADKVHNSISFSVQPQQMEKNHSIWKSRNLINYLSFRLQTEQVNKTQVTQPCGWHRVTMD